MGEIGAVIGETDLRRFGVGGLERSSLVVLTFSSMAETSSSSSASSLGLGASKEKSAFDSLKIPASMSSTPERSSLRPSTMRKSSLITSENLLLKGASSSREPQRPEVWESSRVVMLMFLIEGVKVIESFLMIFL